MESDVFQKRLYIGQVVAVSGMEPKNILTYQTVFPYFDS